jgi:formylglycine-generating enzyme required for sulfatase activity
LPGGKFKMGDDKGNEDEKPVHEVELSPFKISKYPITNAQFEAFMQAHGYEREDGWSKEGLKYRKQYNWKEPRLWDDEKFNLPNQPVVGVSWFEAEAFCAWLQEWLKSQNFISEKETVRLPTEAEWEFAARGKEARKYPWGNAPEPTAEHANYDNSKIARPTAVGTYPRGKTPEGLFDLAGNVWEWCLDWYDEKYYAECKKRGVMKNPRNNQAGTYRVLRGGAYWNNTNELRSARRDFYFPVYWFSYRGFRVVVSAES